MRTPAWPALAAFTKHLTGALHDLFGGRPGQGAVQEFGMCNQQHISIGISVQVHFVLETRTPVQAHSVLEKAPACPGAKNWRRITPFPHFRGQFAMVVIRLARGGAKKRPFFNLVVADSKRARDGRFVERIGFYNPKAPAGQEMFRVQTERLAYWQGKGARLSDTAKRLVKQFGEKKAA